MRWRRCSSRSICRGWSSRSCSKVAARARAPTHYSFARLQQCRSPNLLLPVTWYPPACPPLKTKSLNSKPLLCRSTPATVTLSSCPYLTTPTKPRHFMRLRFMTLRWGGWLAARNHRQTLSAFAFCFEPGSMSLCAARQPAPPPTRSPTLSRRAPRYSPPQ
jgi:hypothetical protein